MHRLKIKLFPWTIELTYAGMVLGENWETLIVLGHKVSVMVVVGLIIIVIYTQPSLK